MDRVLRRGSIVGIAAVVIAGASLGRVAVAEPYLAVRTGYKCSQCHFNPTGGGKRNRFGNIYAQAEMPNEVVSAGEIDRFLGLGTPKPEGEGEREGEGDGSLLENLRPRSTFYSGYLMEFLSVGGDFRVSDRWVFHGARDKTSNSFEMTEGDLYASVEVFEGALAVYVDERVAPGGAAAREAFGILRGPWTSYLKAGRIMLPYGLRLQDDAAFIREVTGFNFGVQDVGVEAGIEPGPFSVSLAASNGTQGTSDDNKDKQITGMASFIRRYWRLGAQGAWNNTPAAKRIAVGGFGGINLGFIGLLGLDWSRFSLLGEADHITDELEALAREPTVRQVLLYGAVDYQACRGVNLRFSYDYADPDTSRTEDSFIRLSTGIEYTVTQFVQLRAFFRFRDDTKDSPRDDEGVLEFELHLFF